MSLYCTVDIFRDCNVLLCEVILHCLAVLQNCGLVILVTSSVTVVTVSLNVSSAMATPTVWTIQMRRHVVSFNIKWFSLHTL